MFLAFLRFDPSRKNDERPFRCFRGLRTLPEHSGHEIEVRRFPRRDEISLVFRAALHATKHGCDLTLDARSAALDDLVEDRP
jgi:hypothetical protein